MGWDGRTERRKNLKSVDLDRRDSPGSLGSLGSLWSTAGGHRLPGTMEIRADALLGEELHPARLRPSDLENPQGFRERLVAWLMKQH